MRLIPPLLTLLASAAFAALGLYLWQYRTVPAAWITDPTSFKIAGFITGAIFYPAVLGMLLSIIALVQRLLPRKEPA